jgi:glycosyltransferase involved in cell wall biosynthesis
MKLIQLFNSSVVSGPENLCVRNLALSGWDWELWNLEERRSDQKAGLRLFELCARLGVKYRAISVDSRRDRRAIEELRSALEVARPGLIHAHDVKASAYLQWSRYEGVPRVSTHHGIFGRPDLKTKAFELFYRYFVLPSFDRVVAVSVDDERVLRGSLGEKVRRIRNGVPMPSPRSEEALAPLRTETRADWARRAGWPERSGDAFWVGIVGRLSAEKNLFFALDVARACPLLRFVFVGDGPLRGELEAKIKQGGLADRVACVGYDEKMPERYPALNVLLSTSLAEGLPLNLLEASACGVPFLARAVGGIPEIPGQGAQDCLVPPDQGPEAYAARLDAWRGNTLERNRLGIELRRRVEAEFSAEAWNRTTAALYAELGFVPKRGV